MLKCSKPFYFWSICLCYNFTKQQANITKSMWHQFISIHLVLIREKTFLVPLFFLGCFFRLFPGKVLLSGLASTCCWIARFPSRKVNSNWSEHTWTSLCCPHTSNSSTQVWKAKVLLFIPPASNTSSIKRQTLQTRCHLQLSSWVWCEEV